MTMENYLHITSPDKNPDLTEVSLLALAGAVYGLALRKPTIAARAVGALAIGGGGAAFEEFSSDRAETDSNLAVRTLIGGAAALTGQLAALQLARMRLLPSREVIPAQLLSQERVVGADVVKHSALGGAVLRGRESTLRIYSHDPKNDFSWLCSGNVISKNGDMLTAAHGLRSHLTPRVILPDGRRVEMTIRAIDDRVDLALLEPKKMEHYPWKAMKLGETPRIWPPGQKTLTDTYTLGHPSNRDDLVVSPGYLRANTTRGELTRVNRISDYLPDESSRRVLSGHGRTVPGMSGGAVLDSRGRLIGVHTTGDPERHITSATALPEIRTFLKRAGWHRQL